MTVSSEAKAEDPELMLGPYRKLPDAIAAGRERA